MARDINIHTLRASRKIDLGEPGRWSALYEVHLPNRRAGDDACGVHLAVAQTPDADTVKECPRCGNSVSYLPEDASPQTTRPASRGG